MKTPKILLLSLAITAALTACNKPADAPAAAGDAKVVAPTAYPLEESRLPSVIHFSPDDLDKSKDACNDFVDTSTTSG